MQSILNSTTSAFWFIFQNDNLLLAKKEEQLVLPSDALVAACSPYFIRQFSLGPLLGKDCFCAEINEKLALPSDTTLIPIRKAFELLGPDFYRIIAKAYAIINGDKNQQFCSRCGNVTTHKINTFERVCTVCHTPFYPRISPSVIVLIKKEDQLLMARSPHFVPGAYGLIAGFVEIGEKLEDAVHREVKEEVNITIDNLRYFDSQPWPFPDSLMVGFTADYAGGDLIIDHNEIEAAGWYGTNNIPGYPSSSISIARKLIDHFVMEQKTGKQPYGKTK